jgi:enoyl-CoA hydratase
LSSLLRVEIDDRVAVLTLDDPERRNVLSIELVTEIVAAFDQLEHGEDVGAVVITGAPPAFCAGADLGHLGADTQQHGLLSVYDGFLRVARSTVPTIAAVNGAAVGAGMNLALACDVRVAARSARFDTRFLKLGLHPGGGHTWMLQRLAGPQAAAAMVLFGEVLDGTDAARTGLVWQCVEDDRLLERARELAAAAAGLPPKLARRTKETLAAVSEVAHHDDSVQIELTAQLWSMQQPEFAERLAAMRQRISKRG